MTVDFKGGYFMYKLEEIARFSAAKKKSLKNLIIYDLDRFLAVDFGKSYTYYWILLNYLYLSDFCLI